MDAEDSRSSEGSGPATRPRRKGKGKTPERPRRPAERHPHDSDPFVTRSDGDGRDRRHRHEPTGCKVGAPGAGGGGGDDTPPSSGGEGPPPPYRSRESTPGGPPPRSEPRWGDMDLDDDMEFDPDAVLSSGGGPLDGGPPGPPGGGPPGGPQGGGLPSGPPNRGPQDRDPLEDRQVGTPPTNRREPASPRTFGDGSCTSRGGSRSWSVRRGSTRWRSARVPPLPPRPRRSWTSPSSSRETSGVVTKLQRRLDMLEDLRSDGSDRPPPLESGSDDSWGPGPVPGRSRRRTEAPRSDHTSSTRGSARRSDPMPPRHSREEERDEWLSAEYRRRRDPLRTPVQPKRPRRAPEPAPPAHGRYGPLGDEVPEEDTEWDLEGPDGDPMEDFGISPPRGSASRRRREEEEYMEGVRRVQLFEKTPGHHGL